jgi:Uma2 family endonuclease
LDLNGTYSYADYLTWRFEQTLEIIKGKILPMAALSRRHQKISSFLHGNLYIFFEKHLCDVYAAPFDVRLFDKNKSIKANKDIFTVIQPDICVVCDESKLDDAGCLGSPDVIIEILLLGNSKKEMKIKKKLYEENSVKEYLIIDPYYETAHQFILNTNEIFDAPKIYASDDILQCALFEGLEINLEKMFV